MCEEIETNKQSRSEILVQTISEYINQKLHDPNLGTKDIADRFDMNAAYLARVFKKSEGITTGAFRDRQETVI